MFREEHTFTLMVGSNQGSLDKLVIIPLNIERNKGNKLSQPFGQNMDLNYNTPLTNPNEFALAAHIYEHHKQLRTTTTCHHDVTLSLF